MPSVPRAWLLFVLLAFLMVLMPVSVAAPKLQTGHQCLYYADVALVARALVVNEVSPIKTERIMAAVYTAPPGSDGPGLIALIVVAAQSDRSAPTEFAAKFLRVCLEGRGNLDSLLGTST